MTLNWIDWLNIVLLVGGLAGMGWILAGDLSARNRVRRRLALAAKGGDTDIISLQGRSVQARALFLLSVLGRRLPIFNANQRKEMRGKLMSAGYRQAGALLILTGLSVAAALLLALLVVLFAWPAMEAAGSTIRMLAALAAAYIGQMLPRIVLDKLVAKRQEAIADSFPDALDLMVVCATAGLGMNATIQRVAQEMDFLAPELSDELSLTSAQLQVSGDAAQVLTEMAERIGLDSVRSLASTLNQSRQYGTPISEALRMLASGERVARRMRTEEAAGKLATKMTLPMMLFILPTVMLIVGGPAILGLMESFRSMAN